MVDGFTESRGIGGDFPHMRESDWKLASESSNLYVSLKYLNPQGIFFSVRGWLEMSFASLKHKFHPSVSVVKTWIPRFPSQRSKLFLSARKMMTLSAHYDRFVGKLYFILLDEKTIYKSLGCISSSLLRHLLYCSSRLWFQTLFPYNTYLDVHGS